MTASIVEDSTLQSARAGRALFTWDTKQNIPNRVCLEKSLSQSSGFGLPSSQAKGVCDVMEVVRTCIPTPLRP